MESFATLEDISILWRELKESEYSKAEQLLTVVSDSLRLLRAIIAIIDGKPSGDVSERELIRALRDMGVVFE